MPNKTRADDAERSRVVETLQHHTVAGRLSLDEFADRVGAAYLAVTVSDLERLTSDLPDEPAWRRLPRARLVAILAGLVLVIAAAIAAALTVLIALGTTATHATGTVAATGLMAIGAAVVPGRRLAA